MMEDQTLSNSKVGENSKKILAHAALSAASTTPTGALPTSPSMTKEPTNEQEIPFQPTNNDVVSTKIRSWNARHPGNVVYRAMIHDAVERCTFQSPQDFRAAAEVIFREITQVRGGRFLLIPDCEVSSTTCKILPEKKAVEKILHALKVRKSRKELEDAGLSGRIPPSKVTGGPSYLPEAGNPKSKLAISKAKSQSKLGNKQKKAVGPTSPRKRLDQVGYKAVPGKTIKIHPSALEMISMVCSQVDPRTAHYVLDTPLGEYTQENEPDQERLARLQMRARFAAGVQAGITPIEMARKLLKMWGGTLKEVKVQPRRRSPMTSRQKDDGNNSAPEVKMEATEGNPIQLTESRRILEKDSSGPPLKSDPPAAKSTSIADSVSELSTSERAASDEEGNSQTTELARVCTL